MKEGDRRSRLSMDGLSAGFPHFMVSLDHPSPEFSGLLLLGQE